jgi:DNA-binding NarL/FixJ family response regulator
MSSGKSGTHAASACDHVPVKRAALDLQSRIIIVGDTRLYRDRLGPQLGTVNRVVVVGVADTVASALTCIEEKKPDVALLDFAIHDALALPNRRGTDASKVVGIFRGRGNKITGLAAREADEPSYSQVAGTE